MGYEVTYFYHERKEEGVGYNTDETKELVRKIGKPHEEVHPERLAAAIMAQLARRDIWVVDVEVYEYTKKKLSFKETKGGVVIGNRKYGFDSLGPDFDVVEEDQQEETRVFIEESPALPSPKSAITAQAHISAPMTIDPGSLQADENIGDQLYFRTHRPIREEMFAPKDPVFANAAKARKLPFTVGKTYPIYEEKAAPGGMMAGMLYTTKDDSGKRHVLSDKYFDLVPNLFAGELFNEDPMSIAQSGEVADMEMPDISGMRKLR